MQGYLEMADIGICTGIIGGVRKDLCCGMKVLHVLYSNQYSGAENVVCQIIDMFRDDADIEMIYCSRDGQIRDTLAERNIRFVPIADLNISELKRVIREQKPDVVHAHDFRASVIAAMACLGKKIRVISHLHNNPPWIKKINKQSLAYLVATLFCSNILLVSEAIKKEYIFSWVFHRKDAVIGNPVNISAIYAMNKDVESSDLIFVGRLSSPKNPHRFIKIIEKLKSEYPRLRVNILGDGELRQECNELIKECDLQDTIKLFGFKKNPYDYMAKSKVLCMTSDWEGFGLVAVEALALGKPVVCSPVGGLPAIVNETCGCLCQTDDEYVAELSYLLKENSYYEEKARGAYKRAKELNNIKVYKDRLKDLYQ